MTLYDAIYNFFMDYFFTHADLEAMEETIGGKTISLNAWLGHTCTLIVLGLFLFVIVMFVRFIFKAVSGAILHIGG